MKKEDVLTTLLENILEHLNEDPDVLIDTSDEGVINITIEGDNLNYLIGHRGQSLEALQNVISLALIREFEEYTTVVVDINGYREGKAQKIRDMTRRYIDKVRFLNDDVELPPMNPWERRQIHMLISEYDDIESESTGERKERRVVLKPKV